MGVRGRVHSIQTMGTLDGPGVRFVIFMQGCNLRCKCCHNPDTWDINGGAEYTAEELVSKILRYVEYFGKDGGVTLSGGEPLLQAEFARELFGLCHDKGINTCLDTSGSILNDEVKNLLEETDRVLLDIKYTDDEMYLENAGCSISKPVEFLEYLDDNKIPATIRQVIIPGLNDKEESIIKLKAIADNHKCADKIELLPFRKICQTKYDNMGIEFPFADVPEPTREVMEYLSKIVKEYI